MALKIGFISQKGGIGKSTLARLLAREYALSGWDVKIADMDTGQETSRNWHDRRIRAGITPEISVEKYGSVQSALKKESQYDLILFDGGPMATSLTWNIASACDALFLPTGLSLDDLEPTINLAHQLKRRKFDTKRLALVFCRVGDSEAELREATEWVEDAGYNLIPYPLHEMTGYRRAHDSGQAVTETAYPTLNEKAERVAQSMVDMLDKLQNGAEKDGHEYQAA